MSNVGRVRESFNTIWLVEFVESHNLLVVAFAKNWQNLSDYKMISAAKRTA